ncbi:MAG: PfkB family carbohydrate kinase, partial [Pseudomonadota bacterium]
MQKTRLIVFGEVLFDQFPDGTVVLGGAPFNVAWHLQALGYAPLLISRVGNDGLGAQIRSKMQDWGMDLNAL